MTGVTSGAGTVYPHGAPEFTPLFSGLCVALSLVFCVVFVDYCLPFSLVLFCQNESLHEWIICLLLIRVFPGNHISYVEIVVQLKSSLQSFTVMTGGRIRSTRRKPPTCHKSRTDFITYLCIKYTSPEQDSNSQL
jgi:hypothetical protein